jgi:rhodanese-related sulfurtransferase
MTVLRSITATAVLVVAIVSCAPPAREVSVKKSAAPVVKEPARLNGRGKTTSISLTDLFALQQSDEALIFDARPRFFYHLGHIPGAISLPKDGCDAEIDKREAEIKAALAAKKTIVVYCTSRTCPDARTVASHLSSFGYSSSTFGGGWDSWKESGLPVE